MRAAAYLGSDILLLILSSGECDLLIGVLRRRNDNILGVALKDENVLDILIFSVAAAAEGSGDDDSQHPEHAEKDADTTSCAPSG